MEFYNQSITRMVATAFMDFFSRISIEKFKTISVSGDYVYAQRKLIPVPIQWATREKWVEIVRSSSARKHMNPDERNKVPVEMKWVLPRISCNLTDLGYDSSRRLIKTQTVPDYSATSELNGSRAYTPAPYSLNFEIAVVSRHLDDNLQIMEQILPHFSPTMNLSLNLYDGSETESIPITLSSVTPENPVDIPENDERFFTYTYNFAVKINYYSMKKIAAYIRACTVNFQAGQEIVRIDKAWIESMQKIEVKFSEYTDNANRPNPFINISSDRFPSREMSEQDIIKYNELIELKYFQDSASGLDSPFIHAFRDVSVEPNLVHLYTDVGSAYQNNYPIYYRINNDSTIYKYTEPFEWDISMLDLYAWTDFTYGQDTNAQFQVVKFSMIYGIDDAIINGEIPVSASDFTVT